MKGLIGLLQDGDEITIDADNNVLHANISEVEIMRRRGEHVIPALRATTGALRKYAMLVSSVSEGCVTDVC